MLPLPIEVLDVRNDLMPVASVGSSCLTKSNFPARPHAEYVCRKRNRLRFRQTRSAHSL